MTYDNHTNCSYSTYFKRSAHPPQESPHATPSTTLNKEGSCMSFKIGRAGFLPQSGLAAFADDDEDSMQQELKGAQAESQRLKVNQF